MKKHVNWLILAVNIIMLIICIFIIRNRHYYSIAEEIDFYKIEHHHDDTLRIAFIGDSWAFHHQEHTCNIDSLLSKAFKRPVTIASTGIPGATSKTIYSEFAKDSPIQIILKNGPDYCVLSAGINDCNIKTSQNFYQQNMKLIIDFLLRNEIIPIIIEIPDYDFETVYNKSTIMQKLRRQFMMFLSGSSIDNREANRQALNLMIEQNGYGNKVILIREKLWNPSGYKDPRHIYKGDGIHLNDKGYELLDSCIIQYIIKNYHK